MKKKERKKYTPKTTYQTHFTSGSNFGKNGSL